MPAFFVAAPPQINKKNAEKITFLHFFCIFLAILTGFSSLLQYLCSEIGKMADMEKNLWKIQEYGTTWKGKGLYHVTLTIPDRQRILGNLIIPNSDPTQAIVKPTPLGRAILDCQRAVQDHYPEIQILHYRLMPDHLHAIWFVKRPMDKGILSAVRGFWQGIKKIGRAYTYLSSVLPNTIRKNTQEILPPSTSPQQIHDLAQRLQTQLDDMAYTQLSPIFTEMPFVRAMSRRSQLPTTIRYIDMNPQRLATKRLKPGYLYVQRSIEIAGRLYNAVGNVNLLDAESMLPVHVRRTMVEAAEHGKRDVLRNYMNSCVLAARNGAVMVSPFISPYERDVLAVLLREKHPVIYLTSDIIGDYYKPSDSLFDACAAGRVLLLNPVGEYRPVEDKRPNGSRRITRNTCVALKALAEEIAAALVRLSRPAHFRL